MSTFEETIRTPNNGKHQKNTIITPPKWPSSRRSHSLSSSPSISSNSSSSFRSFSNEDSPPQTPTTTHNSPPQRIPFSWESIPGKPKHQIIKRIDSPRNSNFLPLPPSFIPHVSSNSTKQNCKKNHIVSRNDPFFKALVECSKSEDEEDEDKVIYGSFLKGSSKSLSQKFGLESFSCKNTCSVAQSLVFLPREQPRRISYGLVKKRSG